MENFHDADDALTITEDPTIIGSFLLSPSESSIVRPSYHGMTTEDVEDDPNNSSLKLFPEILLFVIVIVVASVLISFVYTSIGAIFDEIRFKKRTKRRAETETAIAEYIKEEQKDIIRLMLENQDEIREYFTISKSHARKAFGFAVGAAILGLVLFVGSVIVGLQTGNTDAAIIGAIGGGITEMVSVFALFIYKKSQEQLNHYYKALHENEQYLSTVHLVGKLSEERQDDIYIEIIRSSIEKREQSQEFSHIDNPEANHE